MGIPITTYVNISDGVGGGTGSPNQSNFNPQSVIGYLSLPAMQADLSQLDGTLAIVGNDPAAANNAIYVKAGSPGVGQWNLSTYTALSNNIFILAWAYATAFQLVAATRDANEAIVTANIVWPDGASGIFTTDVASTAFPGAIDAWHATHILNSVTKTITQTAVTRDAAGAVIAQPSITVA